MISVPSSYAQMLSVTVALWVSWSRYWPRHWSGLYLLWILYQTTASLVKGFTSVPSSSCRQEYGYIKKSWLCLECHFSVFSVLVNSTVCSCTCNWGSFIRQCWVFYVWSNLSQTLLFIKSLSFQGQFCFICWTEEPRVISLPLSHLKYFMPYVFHIIAYLHQKFLDIFTGGKN